MKTLLFAAAILVSGSGGLALAQPAGATPEPAPTTVPDGADKVNGLEVPRMKDSQDGRHP